MFVVVGMSDADVGVKGGWSSGHSLKYVGSTRSTPELLEPRRRQMGPAQHIAVAIDGTYIRSTGENWKSELHVMGKEVEWMREG